MAAALSRRSSMNCSRRPGITVTLTIRPYIAPTPPHPRDHPDARPLTAIRRRPAGLAVDRAATARKGTASVGPPNTELSVCVNSLLCGAVILRTTHGPSVARGLGQREDHACSGLGVRHALELHVLGTGSYGEIALVSKPFDGIDQHLVDSIDRHILRRESKQTAPMMNPGACEECIALASDRKEPGHTNEYDAAKHER